MLRKNPNNVFGQPNTTLVRRPPSNTRILTASRAQNFTSCGWNCLPYFLFRRSLRLVWPYVTGSRPPKQGAQHPLSRQLPVRAQPLGGARVQPQLRLLPTPPPPQSKGGSFSLRGSLRIDNAAPAVATPASSSDEDHARRGELRPGAATLPRPPLAKQRCPSQRSRPVPVPHLEQCFRDFAQGEWEQRALKRPHRRVDFIWNRTRGNSSPRAFSKTMET